jgi:hypothetical protein
MAKGKGSRWPQATIMFTGVALIALGILATGLQLAFEITSGSLPSGPPSQSITVSPNNLQAGTRFVGLELVIVGALLEIVGYLATKPWKGQTDQEISN